MAVSESAGGAVRKATAASGAGTSNSFSPSAGSWAYILVNWQFYTNDSVATFTCKDSANHYYTLATFQQDWWGCTANMVFRRYYESAPGSITVTVQCSDHGSADYLLSSRIVTGARDDQDGAGVNTAVGWDTTWTDYVNAIETGSLIYVVAGAGGYSETLTGHSGTTQIDTWTNSTSGDSGSIGKVTALTAAPGLVEAGFNSDEQWDFGWCAIEVLPAASVPAGSVVSLTEWQYPATWQVGDELNADTMNARIRDQNQILLRRPLFVAHNSADVAVTTGTDWSVSFDTVDVDDDGMAMEGTPVTKIYAQREGTYQIWYNTSFYGNGSACANLQASIWLGTSSTYRRWDYQALGATTNGQRICRSINGTVFLNVGEYLVAHCFQSSGSNMTLKAELNCPRIVVMWLGISL